LNFTLVREGVGVVLHDSRVYLPGFRPPNETPDMNFYY